MPSLRQLECQIDHESITFHPGLCLPNLPQDLEAPKVSNPEYCPHCSTVGRWVTDSRGQYFKPTVNVAYAAELEMQIADLKRQREQLAEVLRWYGDSKNWDGARWTSISRKPTDWMLYDGESIERARAVLKSVLGEEL